MRCDWGLRSVYLVLGIPGVDRVIIIRYNTAG